MGQILPKHRNFSRFILMPACVRGRCGMRKVCHLWWIRNWSHRNTEKFHSKALFWGWHSAWCISPQLKVPRGKIRDQHRWWSVNAFVWSHLATVKSRCIPSLFLCTQSSAVYFLCLDGTGVPENWLTNSFPPRFPILNGRDCLSKRQWQPQGSCPMLSSPQHPLGTESDNIPWYCHEVTDIKLIPLVMKEEMCTLFSSLDINFKKQHATYFEKQAKNMATKLGSQLTLST